MIILLGIQGSGKGTQAELLVNRGIVKNLSMGEILRHRATEEQQKQMLAGVMVGDDEIRGYLLEELRQIGDSPEIVLDGFPRTLHQAEWLLKQREIGVLKISAVVNLSAPESVVKKRLLLRGRQDDTPKAITKRINIYQETFKSILQVLGNAEIPILEINADQTPEKIHSDILKELQTKNIEA